MKATKPSERVIDDDLFFKSPADLFFVALAVDQPAEHQEPEPLRLIDLAPCEPEEIEPTIKRIHEDLSGPDGDCVGKNRSR